MFLCNLCIPIGRKSIAKMWKMDIAQLKVLSLKINETKQKTKQTKTKQKNLIKTKKKLIKLQKKKNYKFNK